MFPEDGFVSAKYDISMSRRVSGMAYFVFSDDLTKNTSWVLPTIAYKRRWQKAPNLSGANFAMEQERRDSNEIQCVLLTMSKTCTVFHYDLTFSQSR